MRRTISRSCAVAGPALVGVVLGLSGIAPEARQARAARPASEWRTYGADLASTRYSPLDQITASNFGNLEIAWRFKTDNLGPRPSSISSRRP